MSMPHTDMPGTKAHHACIIGVGFWTRGLPSWSAARAFACGDAGPVADAPARPQPSLLAPNERRRAPDSVAIALEVAQAACVDAGREPQALASVFASTHGDLAIADYMAAALASGDPGAISPTRFHNSVHNAAAGYWTIGSGCLRAATALTAFDGSFAQGLIEALSQLAAGEDAVLLAAYDTPGAGPLTTLWTSQDLLGGALVLACAGNGPRLAATLADGEPPAQDGPLAGYAADSAMAQMLPLFDALATGRSGVVLQAGPGRVLQVELRHG